MSKEGEYKEYEDIRHLLMTDEWYTWIKFLEKRIYYLSDKVLELVHSKKYDEAGCVEAVIRDIKEQIDAFRHIKIDYENKEN